MPNENVKELHHKFYWVGKGKGWLSYCSESCTVRNISISLWLVIQGDCWRWLFWDVVPYIPGNFTDTTEVLAALGILFLCDYRIGLQSCHMPCSKAVFNPKQVILPGVVWLILWNWRSSK